MVRYAGMLLASLLCGSLSAALAAAAGEEIGASSLRSRGVDPIPNSPTRSHLRVSSTARTDAAGAEEAPWWHDARKLQAQDCPSPDTTNFIIQVSRNYTLRCCCCCCAAKILLKFAHIMCTSHLPSAGCT